MKAYDLSGLRKITRGNTEFEMKMLNRFVDQTPSQLEKLEEYLEKEDFEKFGLTAHSIKPSIDLICRENLKTQVRELERIGKEGDKENLLFGLFENFRENLEEVIEDLKADLV